MIWSVHDNKSALMWEVWLPLSRCDPSIGSVRQLSQVLRTNVVLAWTPKIRHSLSGSKFGAGYPLGGGRGVIASADGDGRRWRVTAAVNVFQGTIGQLRPIGKARRAVMPPRPNIPGMVVAGGVAVQALEPLDALEENELGHPRRTVGEKPAAGQTGIKVYLEKHCNRTLTGPR
jgi:hypothetical protein